MKKSKVLILLIPFFAFLISISDVKAACSVIDGKEVCWDENEGGGKDSTGDCSSSNNNICRASGKSSYPQYLYASLTNDATKSNGKVVLLPVRVPNNN